MSGCPGGCEPAGKSAWRCDQVAWPAYRRGRGIGDLVRHLPVVASAASRTPPGPLPTRACGGSAAVPNASSASPAPPGQPGPASAPPGNDIGDLDEIWRLMSTPGRHRGQRRRGHRNRLPRGRLGQRKPATRLRRRRRPRDLDRRGAEGGTRPARRAAPRRRPLPPAGKRPRPGGLRTAERHQPPAHPQRGTPAPAAAPSCWSAKPSDSGATQPSWSFSTVGRAWAYGR